MLLGDGLTKLGYDTPKTTFDLRYEYMSCFNEISAVPSANAFEKQRDVIEQFQAIGPSDKVLRLEFKSFD